MKEDEQLRAYNRVVELIDDFLEDHKFFPTSLYVSDDEELQSYLLWAGLVQGLKISRTKKVTHVN